MDKTRAIGKNDQLPWPAIKEDFAWFKEFTKDQQLIVGRVTFQTLPILKNRHINVLSRLNSDLDLIDYGITANKENGIWVNNYNNIATHFSSKEDVLENIPNGIIAGGAKIYELFLPEITEFYITHVNGSYYGDTFMPPFEYYFNSTEIIKEFVGGHKVVKYFKSY